MQEFDKRLWLERAGARLRRSSRKGVPVEQKRTAEVKWGEDIVSIQRLEILVAWCTSRGLSVKFAKKKGATYHTGEKTITVAGRMSPERQVFFLLHECGHHLIGYTEYDERFGRGYPMHDDPNINSTFHHKMACLEEEIEAWNRGWRLAKRLRLGLNRESFDEVRVECLRTYVSWANGRWKAKFSTS